MRCSSVSRTAARGSALAPTPTTPRSALASRASCFREWALANPSAWAYHRPMVEENKGWAVFITTPRGRNHAFAMYNHAGASPEWFCELLTANDTEALTRGGSRRDAE